MLIVVRRHGDLINDFQLSDAHKDYHDRLVNLFKSAEEVVQVVQERIDSLKAETKTEDYNRCGFSSLRSFLFE